MSKVMLKNLDTQEQNVSDYDKLVMGNGNCICGVNTKNNNRFRFHLSSRPHAPLRVTFFPPHLDFYMIAVLRTGWQTSFLESHLYEDDLNKAYCPLGQAGKLIRSSSLEFGYRRSWSNLAIQEKKRLMAPLTGPKCQSCMFLSWSTLIEDAPNSKLQPPWAFYLLTCVTHSYRGLELWLQLQMIPWLKRSR